MKDVATDLRRQVAEIQQRYGPFSRQLYIRDGVWTLGDLLLDDEGKPALGDFRLRWLMQGVSDLAIKPIAAMRVLDLGCEEGSFSLEFARRGANVLAIDAREDHIERARFLAEEIGCAERFETRVGDVRELSAERDGQFDLVLCLGLLYHLDAPDIFEFLEELRAMTTWALAVSTRIAVRPRTSRERNGNRYFGMAVSEHRPSSSSEERVGSHKWASIDNPESFWLTRRSLTNALQDAGFTSVLEQLAPAGEGAWEDMTAMFALAGSLADIKSAPGAQDLPVPRTDDAVERRRDPIHSRRGRLQDALRRRGFRKPWRGRRLGRYF